MQPILLGGPSLLCVVVTVACMKLFIEIFAVWHSPYLVIKCELDMPASTKKMAGNIFATNENYKKKTKILGLSTWFVSLAHSRHTRQEINV